MKAYQIHKGDIDKHGHVYFELIATYLDKDKAFNHAEIIAKNEPLMHDDLLEFDGWYADSKCASWSIVGWDRLTIARFQEIEITE
jgi:hypothetical protein